MRKHLLLIAGFISLLVFNIAKAQDSTHYDLGRISVNKNFTQSITIKASDLERYQFNYITDALKVFFYGTFTNATSVVYVIDGNIVTDVDTYNIQDIEEITLVQNALGQVSGASPMQQMILIKTRRGGAGKQGIIASNQTSLVNARNNNNYVNATKPTGVYEQAYLGAYKNYTNGDIGVSAGFLHDISPRALPADNAGTDPFHYNELRLNAYADARLWKGTTLNFGFNYTYEPGGYGNIMNNNTSTIVNEFASRSHEAQHLVNTNIALRSHIVGGLTNTLSAGYNHYADYEMGTATQYIEEPQFGYYYHYNSLQKWQQHEHTFLLKDNLVYHQQFGDWSIDPSVDFTYRHVSDTLGVSQVTYLDSIPNNAQSYASSQTARYNLSLLTPSVDIYYKDIFDIHGGFTGILNKEHFGASYITVDHVLPFASASFNVPAIKLRLFASFSRQNDFLDDPYVSLAMLALQGFDDPAGTYSSSLHLVLPTSFNALKSYNNYQAGFTLELWKNFNFSYNFRENYHWIYAAFVVPDGGNGSEVIDALQDAKFITHSVALDYHLHSGNFDWATGLTATTSKFQLIGQPVSQNQPNTYLSTGHRWTGGFANRLMYKNLFAGLNILYQMGERPYDLQNWIPNLPGYVPPSNKNSFSLQNLYIGERVKINHLKYAEIYLNTRNILQNNSSDITDERRFYGFGFKLNL
ncbi:MAG: hypothetical protein ACXVIY_01795 [Mucilaginibacter sp.]